MKKTIMCFMVFLLIPLFSHQINSSASIKSREEYEKTGHVIWEVNTKEKLVAITFDDGPHPIFTPQILDILAKYNAKATFFVTGSKAVRYPEILKREIKDGHEIGNHTFHHIGGNITAAKLTAELEQTDEIIQRSTGFKPTLYRPVEGRYNDIIINTALKNRKDVILWSWHQDTRDWSDPPVNQICDQVTKGVMPGNIILFHDWHGSEYSQNCRTVPALNTILDFLYKNGYKCVTVSELLYRSKQIIPDFFGIYPEKISHIDFVY
jgi:peptidoglycan-N-acetylglucosamine deacetylase